MYSSQTLGTYDPPLWGYFYGSQKCKSTLNCQHISHFWSSYALQIFLRNNSYFSVHPWPSLTFLISPLNNFQPQQKERCFQLTKKMMSMMIRTYLMKLMLQQSESRFFGFFILICFCGCCFLLDVLLPLLLLLLLWLEVPFLADLFGAIALLVFLSVLLFLQFFLCRVQFKKL